MPDVIRSDRQWRQMRRKNLFDTGWWGGELGTSSPTGDPTAFTTVNPEPDDRLQELEAQQARMDEPLTMKQKIARAAALGIPLALGAAFGGESGAIGAGQAAIGYETGRQEREGEARGLLREEIEKERERMRGVPMEEATLENLKARTEKLQRPDVPPTRKHVGSYTNAEGQRVDIYETPEGKRVEELGQGVYQTPDDITSPFEAYSSDDPRLKESAEEWLKLQQQYRGPEGGPAPPAGTWKERKDERGNVVELYNPVTGETKPVPGGPMVGAQGQKSIRAAMDVLQDSELRMEQMREAVKNPNAQNDVLLLFNHMGMTLGAQRGSRMTNAMIMHAINSRSVPQKLMVMWDQVQTGRSLSPTQRQQMMGLAEELYKLNKQRVEEERGYYGVGGQAEPEPEVKEGTVIVGPEGDRLVLRNGQWVPLAQP